MKTSARTTAIILTLLPTAVLSGQGGQARFFTYEFRYGSDDKYAGTVHYVMQAQSSGQRSYIGREGHIELTEGDTLTIALTNYIHDEDGDQPMTLRDKYRIIASPPCADGSQNIALDQAASSSTFTLAVEKDNDGRFQKSTGRFVFVAERPIAQDRVSIGFEVVKNKENSQDPCKYRIIIPCSIKRKPVQDPCPDFLAAFRTEKDCANLRTFVGENPDAPCADDLKNYLGQCDDRDRANAETDPAKALSISSVYLEKHKDEGLFSKEMADIKAVAEQKLAEAAEKERRDKDKGPKTTAKPQDPAQTDYQAIKNSENPQDFLGFLDKHTDLSNPWVQKARERLAILSPVEIKEEIVDKMVRRYTLGNTTRPRYKDMSLGYGLRVNAEALESTGTLIAIMESPGEYKIYIEDAHKKNTALTIASFFRAELSPPLPGNRGRRLRISGGTPPYSIELVDTEKNRANTFKSKISTDTTSILFAEMTYRGLNKRYEVVVVGSGNKERFSVGTLVNEQGGSTALQDIVLTAAVLLAALAACYFLFVFFRRIKTQQRYATTTHRA